MSSDTRKASHMAVTRERGAAAEWFEHGRTFGVDSGLEVDAARRKEAAGRAAATRGPAGGSEQAA